VIRTVDRHPARSYHPAMPMWRCPHCATPQPEASRCWVCRRSSICCATCRHFRRSIAATLAYCGLDRRREPLAGDEIRACWESATARVEPPLPAIILDAAGSASRTPVRSRREFVSLDEAGETDRSPALTASVPGASSATGSSGPDGWTLFPDLER